MVDCSSRNKIGTNPVYRTVSLEAMSACYKSLPCAASDDQCTTVGATGVSNDPANFPGVQDSFARHTACETNATGGFSDDLCVFPILLTPSAANAFTGCLAGPCEATSSCLSGITGAVPN